MTPMIATQMILPPDPRPYPGVPRYCLWLPFLRWCRPRPYDAPPGL